MNNKSSKLEEMKKDALDNYLKPLEELRQVEAPPFLLTRIRQAVLSREKELVSPAKVLLAGLAFCILLFVNTFVLLRNNQAHKKEMALTQSFDLLTDNDFYK